VTTRESDRRRRWRRRWAWTGASVLLLLVALGVAGCSLMGGQFKPVIATPEMTRQGLTSRFVDSAEGRIHYVVAGEGSPRTILFVHGSPGTWEAWRGYLDAPDLRRTAHLVALDRPGFGGSERGHAEPSLARQADALVAVLDAARVRRALVVGHSLGGPIAAQFAVDHPDRLAGLVLVAPSISPRLERHRWFNVAGSLMAVQWFLPVDLVTSNREIWPLRKQLEALAPRLAQVQAPVIVLQGDQDTLVSPANADFAESAFTAARLEVRRLPGATHFVVWQDPAVVRRAILDALDEETPQPPAPPAPAS